MSRVAIVGAAQTKHSAALADENHQDLAYRIVKEVLEATGLKQQDLEMVINAGSDILDGRGISTYMMVEALGAQLTEETKVAEDGGYAALYAWMRIAAGAYDLALVIAYGKSSESHPHWYHNMIFDPFYGQPLGLDLLNSAALQANAYAQKYGIKEEQAARVVVKNLRNAKNNPYALRKGDYSLEEVMSSPYLATPIKELDAYPVTDGACALIMCSESKAKELGLKPVWVEGVGTCQEAFYLGNRDLTRLASAEDSAKKAYAMAGISKPIEELDLAEIYADFSYQELMLYEALGFCPEGGGGTSSTPARRRWARPSRSIRPAARWPPTPWSPPAWCAWPSATCSSPERRSAPGSAAPNAPCPTLTSDPVCRTTSSSSWG